MKDTTWASYLFRPAQLLERPSIIPPSETGKISVALQFIVPGLHISKTENEKYKKLLKNCSGEVYGSDMANVKNRETGTDATRITIAFYIDYLNDGAERHQAIENKARILIERFLGIVSYCAGIKLGAENIINTIVDYPNFKAILNVTSMTQSPRVGFSIPQELIDNEAMSEEIFAALFWLRRGLAQSDPIDTYNAFMVCMQILARHWWEKKIPGTKIPAPTFLFKKYITSELGIDPGLVDKAWKKRNAIAAHGNKLNIDADDFIGLTELKFEAVDWAYKGINLALGLDPENEPTPSLNFFVTDALMNLD